VKEFEQGPPLDAPVAIRLVGADLDQLGIATRDVAAALATVDGLTRIADPLAVRRTDLTVTLDRAAAGERGVSPSEVARSVRFGLAGLEVASLRDPDGDELPIVAHLARRGEPALADLQRLHVARASGGTVRAGRTATTTPRRYCGRRCTVSSRSQ